MGSENGWGLGEGTNYQFGRGSKKNGFRHYQVKGTLLQGEAYFDVTHVAVNLIRKFVINISIKCSHCDLP